MEGCELAAKRPVGVIGTEERGGERDARPRARGAVDTDGSPDLDAAAMLDLQVPAESL